MFTPRLPKHPLFRALAIRRLQERKRINAEIMADQNRFNYRTKVVSTTFAK